MIFTFCYISILCELFIMSVDFFNHQIKILRLFFLKEVPLLYVYVWMMFEKDLHKAVNSRGYDSFLFSFLISILHVSIVWVFCN